MLSLLRSVPRSIRVVPCGWSCAGVSRWPLPFAVVGRWAPAPQWTVVSRASASSVVVPRERLTVSFARSSGPGGQNVNKVNTKAEIRFHVDRADWLPDEVRTRLKELYGNHINKDGEMVFTSSKTRSQSQNLSDALDKLQNAVDEAAVAPKERIPTTPPAYARVQKINEKKLRSAKKQGRGGGGGFDL